MATLNYAFKELSCKLVYYGCGLCGKTTNLIYIHKTVPQKFRGELVSLATEQDRTLFFDFLPLDLGEVKGFKTKFQLYTVPGQVYYNATRKLVLRGVDGLVFVVDSQKDRFQENIDSLENLKQNLAEYGLHLQNGPDDHDGIPWVIQYNKRDMPQVASVEELDKAINFGGAPTVEAVAVSGQGVKDTLKSCSSLVIKKLNAETPSADEKKTTAQVPAATQKPAAPAPAPQAAPAPQPAQPQQPAAQQPAEPAPAPTPQRPAIPDPKPAPAPQPAPAEPAAATPSTPQINSEKSNKALWRGLGLGSAKLTIQNLVGGESDQYQISGKVYFLGIFGGSVSRKLRYKGKEGKSENGTQADYFKFVTDDGESPDIEAWVSDDANQDLFMSYIGSTGQIDIVPAGKKPLT